MQVQYYCIFRARLTHSGTPGKKINVGEINVSDSYFISWSYFFMENLNLQSDCSCQKDVVGNEVQDFPLKCSEVEV